MSTWNVTGLLPSGVEETVVEAADTPELAAMLAAEHRNLAVTKIELHPDDPAFVSEDPTAMAESPATDATEQAAPDAATATTDATANADAIDWQARALAAEAALAASHQDSAPPETLAADVPPSGAYDAPSASDPAATPADQVVSADPTPADSSAFSDASASSSDPSTATGLDG